MTVWMLVVSRQVSLLAKTPIEVCELELIASKSLDTSGLPRNGAETIAVLRLCCWSSVYMTNWPSTHAVHNGSIIMVGVGLADRTNGAHVESIAVVPGLNQCTIVINRGSTRRTGGSID